MDFLNKEATIIFERILRRLKGDSVELTNKPFYPLLIEKSVSGIETEWGKAQLYDVCLHYFNGDVMRVPEIGFAVIDKRGRKRKDYDRLKIAACYLQHDDLRKYETSVKLDGNRLIVRDPELQKSHTHFADHWLIDLYKMGYLD